MKLIGLSGPVAVGKDTIADYLVERHGYTKFSFSDPLYEEAAAAFGMDKAVLYVRETKEQPMEALQYFYCKDMVFRGIMAAKLAEAGVKYVTDAWCSPRQITQWWGTEYRRMQDPEYWIKKAALYVEAWWDMHKEKVGAEEYVAPGGLVNCSVRFPNERAFIHAYNGEVWHVQRPGWDKNVQATAAKHIAEQGLPVHPEDKVIVNAGTIEQLHTGTVLLLGSRAGARIECKPVEPDMAIQCEDCGVYHREFTDQQAQAEIDNYAQYRNSISGEAASRLPPDLKLEEFGKCQECGGSTFGRSAIQHATDSMPGIIPARVADFEG